MKKIIISFLTLVLLFMSLGTATYAWITMARTNIIDEITIYATLGADLEISLDGENYYSELPASLLYENIEKSCLLEVTTLDGINFHHREEDVRVEKNRDYLSFDFYIRTDSIREHEVYLANNISNEISYEDVGKEGTYIISRGVKFKSPITFLYDIDDIVEAGEIRTYYASKAVRISTITEVDGEKRVKVFDLSGDEHRGYAKPYGATSYFNTRFNTELVLPEEGPKTFYKLSEFEEDAPFALDDTSHILSLTETMEVDGKTYYYGKVTVNIWLEGWDADLFDSVLKDRIKIQLQFKAVRK
ncbi:MAG: hypothetical protein GX931_06005 [Acholeplasmataceae bacterium]|nr:hypothetical protein [Acholeplasmataceae bacterium]